MIIQVSAELLLLHARTGNEIHARCIEGINPDDYELIDVHMTDAHTVELVLKHKDEHDEVSAAIFCPKYEALDCRPRPCPTIKPGAEDGP